MKFTQTAEDIAKNIDTNLEKICKQVVRFINTQSEDENLKDKSTLLKTEKINHNYLQLKAFFDKITK